MRLCLALVFTVALLIAAPAVADWDPQNPSDMAAVKMHFPQLPDPNGWDVEISSWDNMHECADDWTCTETGPVTDIHFWTSVQGDGFLPGHIDTIVVTIYDNDLTGPFSTPGNALWTRAFGAGEFTMVEAGQGNQGFADPQLPWWQENDHQLYYQINIDNFPNAFIQQEGEVYWLGIYVFWNDPPKAPVGWKTADVTQYPPPYTDMHYMDDAVFREFEDGPWIELIDPLNQQSLDFAFVITTQVVPTLNQWGLLALVLLLLTAGTVVALRLRRRTA